MVATDLEEHYDKIYRYCYMRTRHRQAAEDITQETFLRFMEHYEGREIEKMLAYLYTIAKNLCIDYYRGRAASFREAEIFEAAEKSDEVKEISGSRENDIVTRESLQQALGKLNFEERELIFLRYINEVPLGQMSRIYGVSRFALYRRLQACLKKLEKNLKI